LFYGLPAHAETASTGQVALLDMPLERLLALDVVTASKFRQAASEAPSSVTVLTAEDIRTYGWRTLADALASIRGLYVTNDQNYAYLGTRGFARPGDYTTRVLLLIDGVRSNDAMYDQAAIGYDAPIDIDLIERIEYVPGSGSSIYGSSAFFGVINIITKGAGDFRHPQASVAVGSAGERKARASYGYKTDNGASFLMSATGFRRKGRDQYYPEFNSPDTNFGLAQGLDHERNGSVFLKAGFGPFTASLTHNERERGIPTASYGQAFNDPRSRTSDMHTVASLTYQDKLNEDVQVLSRVFAGQHVYKGDYAYAAPDYFNHDDSKAKWIGTEANLLYTGWRGHKILTGFEYQHNHRLDQSSANEYPAGSLDAPVYSDAPQRVSILDDRRSGSRAGYYLQDEIMLSDDFLFNLGVRYDHNENAPSATSPRLALIYKPAAGTTIKGIYGKAFRAPNAYEMYYFTEGQQKANTDLNPERVRSLELTLQHALSSQSSVTVTIFRNKVTGLISQTEDPDDGLLVYRNLSSATARGLGLQYEYAAAHGMQLRASQSWQRAKDDETGQHLENSPRSMTKLNFSLPVWRNQARAGLEARYIGRRLTRDGDTSGYWLTNATLYSAKFIERAELSLSIYNLFDRHYGDPGNAEHVQATLPQEGRAFRLKLDYSF
jgi:iron complex outermembrane receptor protein